MWTETLLEIYRRALASCEPSQTAEEACRTLELRGPVNLVSIGKCAGTLFDGASRSTAVRRALVVVPAGYPEPIDAASPIELVIARGSHPSMGAASFAAGKALLHFVATSELPILFFVSGGASACVEAPLEPWFSPGDLIHANEVLLRAGLPISSMNVVRKHLSAIKGGRLAGLARLSPTTMIYSDVATARLADVGSGPTLADPSTAHEAAAILESTGDERCTDLAARLRTPSIPETPKQVHGEANLLADNRSLVQAAAAAATRHGDGVHVIEDQIECDVEQAARDLLTRLGENPQGTVLIAGGEPSVVVRGTGTGGRCSELAARTLRHARQTAVNFVALFGSSDGVDGNTGAAGVVLDTASESCRAVSIASIDEALDRSDTFSLVRQLGDPIMIPPTGNNLRDLYLLVRDERR